LLPIDRELIPGALPGIFFDATRSSHLRLAAVATLWTWFMTLLIQRAEHRDTQAIHAKLDELLSVNAEARTDLSRLDEEESEDIERKRGKADL
jgi:low affinity Fe/Cu permease